MRMAEKREILHSQSKSVRNHSLSLDTVGNALSVPEVSLCILYFSEIRTVIFCQPLAMTGRFLPGAGRRDRVWLGLLPFSAIAQLLQDDLYRADVIGSSPSSWQFVYSVFLLGVPVWLQGQTFRYPNYAEIVISLQVFDCRFIWLRAQIRVRTFVKQSFRNIDFLVKYKPD